MLQLEPVIAHRGASAYAPENTMAAFNKALELGCRFIEFDVMLSEDGEAFVFHDELLKRTTNGRGKFGLTSADDIRQLDAGRWFARRFKGEKVPSFREVLEWMVASNVQANIEIKPFPGKAEETTVAVLTQLNRFWPKTKSWPLLSSFDWSALHLSKLLSPEIPLGLLLDKWDKEWLNYALDLQCYSIHLNRRALTKARVEEIKEKNYKICAYTVNSKRQANKLFNWGVDAVFSDYPDLVK